MCPPRQQHHIMTPLALFPVACCAFLNARSTATNRKMRCLASTSLNAITSLPSLNSPDGTSMTPEVLSDKLKGKRVALYFAAGWCPMCTSFEPSLLQFRKDAALVGNDLEIIYVPSDRSEADAVKRTKALKMISVPIGDEADEMKKRWKIWAGVESIKLGTGRRSGVPALVVLNAKNGDELAFLPAESQGADALRSWPLDDADGLW